MDHLLTFQGKGTFLLMSSQVQFGCLVPAAGASRRMGTNKLQLPFRGSTVLRSTLLAIDQLKISKKVVVCREEDFVTTANDKIDFTWIDGKNSKTLHQSIRLGLPYLADCEAVMIALADQPWLTKSDYETIFQEFLNASSRGFSLLRPWNGERPGNPCVIHKRHFAEILREPDQDKGCSYLFQRYPNSVSKILLPKEHFEDLDTMEDYQKWNF